MSGKLSGLTASAALVLGTILLSWLAADRNFRHILFILAVKKPEKIFFVVFKFKLVCLLVRKTF